MSCSSARSTDQPAPQGLELLGVALLHDALERVACHAEAIGIRALLVHALDGDAAAFYRRHGFIKLLDDPLNLFLPMTVIRKLMTPAQVTDG